MAAKSEESEMFELYEAARETDLERSNAVVKLETEGVRRARRTIFIHYKKGPTHGGMLLEVVLHADRDLKEGEEVLLEGEGQKHAVLDVWLRASLFHLSLTSSISWCVSMA